MKFDYKQGMQEREKLLTEQNKLLNQITDAIKQPFQEWYTHVDKNKVTWFISQFLSDCGYIGGMKDYQMYFSIPTGADSVGLITNSLNRYGYFVLAGSNKQALLKQQEEIILFLENQLVGN